MVTKNTDSDSTRGLLARLADAYGVQTGYRDVAGRLRGPSPESLIKTLLALGAAVNGEQGLEGALRKREAELRDRVIDPVVVAWEGALPTLNLRLPAARAGDPVRLTLVLEDGSSLEMGAVLGRVAAAGRALIRGWEPGRLPLGRHRLRVEAAGGVGEAWVIAAPRRCWEDATEEGGAAAQRGAGPDATLTGTIDAALAALDGKRWGVFAPVYALRSRRDWGAGDLADLASLVRWTGEAGGSIVATLPLLASAFGEGADPSPYRPVSRLFWNEFFLAPEDTVEWQQCSRTGPEWEPDGWRRRRDALRGAEYVDYEAVMALKRPALAELSRCFFEGAGAARRQDFARYLAANPHAAEYATFSAVGHDGRVGQPIRVGADGQVPREEQCHLYCQWQMDRQLAAVAASGGPGLLFDLPLGVHPLGFDAQKWPGLFASGMSTGAPPDAFFSGQDWCTPPLHPEADRLRGYAYFSACLRNLMRHASAVRIDHMMSFHRLFWIPEGSDPGDGVYVTYPAEEMYALLSLESNRLKTTVVGEDLGTVPAGVRAAMRRHGVARTSILLGALRPLARTLEVDIPAGAVVTLETHDMFPLAGFLHGDDIETRAETGQLDGAAVRRETAARRRLVARLARQSAASSDAPDTAAPAILADCLAFLARSAAKMVLVNLEDLLLERRPQNVPGTGAERRNWRRKVAVALEDLPRYNRASR
jgi:4-alpha-glucanotransferase